MKKTLLFAITMAIIIGFGSCSNKSEKKGNQQEQSGEKIKETKPAVCIWNKGSIREEPKKGAKWVSSMALGEELTWLGETKVDSAKNVKYHKIQLSDKTSGWASEYTVVIDATPGVIIKEASIYQRPDLLTVSDDKFDKMDIIAVKEQKDKWSKVIGARKKEKGWIKSDHISDKRSNIAVALLSQKALNQKDKNEKIKQLKKITSNASFQESSFMPELKEKLDKLTAPADTSSTKETQPVKEES